MDRWGMLALTLCAGLAACEGPAPEAGRHASRVIVVRDALDDRPVAGATVVVGGRERVHRTDAAGRATIDAAGSIVVHADAPAHLGGWRPVPADAQRAALRLWPAAPSEAAVDAHLTALERARVRRDDPDDPVLRPEARAWIRGEAPPVGGEGGVGAVRAALDAPPESIRIWRRSLDGAGSSCEGRVDVIDFEEYVKGVLPHEWISSWEDASLRAGAMAIRTYAWQWVRRGGKYDCADLDDTARSQVYDDDRIDRASQAVDDTRGVAITSDGELVSGEYSAENGDPTELGVDEPLCTGREVRGHGRGMCQWGSQRWALEGRDHEWIATHYYPGSIVEGGGPSLPDWDASFVRLDAPATLTSGERAEVVVALRNEGRRSWDVSGTRLATVEDRASALYDPVNWFSESRPTPPDMPGWGTGDVGTFTFRVIAPEVDAARTITEAFRLVHAGADGDTWFGPEVALSIRVAPVGGEVPASDAGSASGEGDASFGSGEGLRGGCAVGRHGDAAWWGLALLAVGCAAVRRRRR